MIAVEHLTKRFGKNLVLDDISETIEQGEKVVIIGPSGSGKSTLLHLLGGVDRPTAGKVYVGGVDVYAQNEEELAVFRRHNLL